MTGKKDGIATAMREHSGGPAGSTEVPDGSIRMGAALAAAVRDGTRIALRGYFVPVLALWRLFDRQHAAIERAHRMRQRGRDA